MSISRETGGPVKPGEQPDRVERPQVEALDEILGVPLKVLDDGFVRVVDYMGADESIVQAARVSYGRGTKKVHEDRGLIRYLMRHWHTTPFEMCDIKLHVRVPMDCWRQWIRHRTACLAEGSEVYFDVEGGADSRGGQICKRRIEDLWEEFHRGGAGKGEMRVRHLDESSLRIDNTRVVDVHKNGRKPVFAMVLQDGKRIEATRDHRFLFAQGWRTLAEATGLAECGGLATWNRGDHWVYVNGIEIAAAPGLEPRPRGGSHVYAKLVRIARFEYVGERETYDVEVEGPHHNFIANGIVTHNSVNEYSTRYSIAIDASQRTGEREWRMQAGGNRQGSEGFFDVATGRTLTAREAELQSLARTVYQERLDLGVAREQARKDLPLSTYTEAYWKVNLHNLLHFLRLRMDPHAQDEIRDYARVIGEQIVARWCPITWEAFLDYQVSASSLTRLEQAVVRAWTTAGRAAALAVAEGHGWLERGDKGLKVNRERAECEDKLRALGLPVPWES
ncbi:MAG: FAD-dependent thymidylate synthase [Deltaproteobacteria bacterium]|nr:FAD-dependent thymidylate synthase [Deltaproteobacteria bacterium]